MSLTGCLPVFVESDALYSKFLFHMLYNLNISIGIYHLFLTLCCSVYMVQSKAYKTRID